MSWVGSVACPSAAAGASVSQCQQALLSEEAGQGMYHPRGHHILTAGVGRRRRRQVVLEEQVVLVCQPTDAPEDVALHEVVHIGAEAINDLTRSPSQDCHTRRRYGCDSHRGRPRYSAAGSGRS